MTVLQNKWFILVMGWLFITQNMNAQVDTLSLQECREMAVENNLMLKSSSEKMAQSEYVFKMYRSNYFPKISATAGYLYSTANLEYSLQSNYLPNMLPDPLLWLDVQSVFNVGVQLVQPIFLGGKIYNATKLAKLGIDVALLEQQKTRAEVIVDADEAYYMYIKVKELWASAQSYHSVVQEFYRQVENGYKKGMMTKNDLLKVQVKCNEAELMLLQAKNGIRLARMNLCYHLGLPLTTMELEVDDVLELDASITSSSLDISARPEYIMLQKNVEAKHLETKIARSDYLPSVSAIASYAYTNGVTLNDEKIFDDDGFSVAVMLKIPITQWAEGQRKVLVSQHAANMAQNDLDYYTQQMTMELLQSMNQYEEAVMKVALTKKSLTQAEENMRVSGNQHKVGMETTANYLEVQALWQQAVSQHIDAKAEQRLAYSRYLKVSGKEF